MHSNLHLCSRSGPVGFLCVYCPVCHALKADECASAAFCQLRAMACVPQNQNCYVPHSCNKVLDGLSGAVIRRTIYTCLASSSVHRAWCPCATLHHVKVIQFGGCKLTNKRHLMCLLDYRCMSLALDHLAAPGHQDI